MPTIAEIRSQFPMYSDLSDGELVRGVHRKFYADMDYPAFLRKIDFRKNEANPTEGMSTTEKVLAGAGKAFVDVGRGVKQIASSDAPTMGGLVTGDKRSAAQQSVDDAKELDKPLMATGAGLAGNIVGNAAMFAPTAAIPGANTYTGAALTGAALSALQPVATGESRGMNAAVGAGAGVAGQALGNALGRVLKPVASTLSPEEQALAAAAAKEGIPLTAGQKTGSRPLQIAESVMENLPLTSGPQLAGREAQQRAFTAAALRRAGMTGDSAGAQALVTQKQALGSTLGGIAERNSLDFNQGLSQRLAAIVSDAESHLPPSKAAEVAGTVKQILQNVPHGSPEKVIASKILSESGAPFTKTVPAVPPGPMSGTNYQGWREPLRGLASEGGATGRIYGQIRSALDDAFRTQLSGAEGEAFRDTSRQYANLKTIMDAMGGAGNLPARGQVAPAQLGAALGRSVGREGKALGRGDLNELARVGQTFVRDQIPNSGTAQRQLMQALFTGGGGAGIGGGTAMAMGKDPMEGMAYGAGIGGGALVAPRLIQALMNSRAGQAYMTEGAVNLTPAAREALSAALRGAAISSTPALGQQ